MNKKEKKILDKFYNSLDYKENFNKIENQINYNQKINKKKYNFKIVSTALACAIIVGAIMPFTIDYLDKKYPKPTVEPSIEHSFEPTEEPTAIPSYEPTVEPTIIPSSEPTVEPTEEYTAIPSSEPTVEPTIEPTIETSNNPELPEEPEIPEDPTGQEKTIVIEDTTYLLTESRFDSTINLDNEEFVYLGSLKVYLALLIAYDELTQQWYTLTKK